MFQTFLHQTNFLALLVSAIVYFFIGFVWYSFLFSKTWVREVGRTEEQLRAGSKIIFLYTFFALILICFVTSFIVWFLGTRDMYSAVKLGLFLSIGYTSTVVAIGNWYGQRSVKLTLIDAGYHVVGIVAATIILSLWR